ncbi:unnamed protein product [Caenorhabditis angaria]|uniref:CC domain-containing protein n=1 Tax=Caenorhabditis angaria TaxID=860376 RepID=A0A9P1N1E9_9PELO|nr:unnamed protein product [Caenorhabditis angaria]
MKKVMQIFLIYFLLEFSRAQFFLCGSSPNQYYSEQECPSNLKTCPNGGLSLNVGCQQDFQCTPYSTQSGATCINGICCTNRNSTVPATVPTVPTQKEFGICPSGQLSEVKCGGANLVACAMGQICTNGLCCTKTGNEWNSACGGLAALSSCNSLGQCATGSVCVSSNYCCECQIGQSYGTCANSTGGSCPRGFQCNFSTGFCCPPTRCANGEMPLGACSLDGKCGGGKMCQPGNICC